MTSMLHVVVLFCSDHTKSFISKIIAQISYPSLLNAKHCRDPLSCQVRNKGTRSLFSENRAVTSLKDLVFAESFSFYVSHLCNTP
jgi:hypothetical protein